MSKRTNTPVSRRAFLTASALAPLALAGCAHTATFPTSRRCWPDEPAPGGNADAFHNWAETLTCKPDRFCQPQTQEEIIRIVKSALQEKKHIRAVGAGHSWAPLVLTGDILMNLDRMQNVSTDLPKLAATMQAGIRLKNLTPILGNAGLGMRNLGSIREQSIAGATATGTHGTGLTISNLSTQVSEMTLVTGTGDVRTFRASDHDLDFFHAARVSLGALGVVTEVKLDCVPNYDVEYAAYWCQFDEALSRLDALIHDNERVRLWWLVRPLNISALGIDNVIVTTMNAPKAGSPPPSNVAPLPMDTDKLLKSLSSEGRHSCLEKPFRHFVGNYVKALTLPLLPVLHHECEYAVPVDRAVEALRAFRQCIVEESLSITLPVEVRFVAKDDSLLSPARGRDVCYIGVSTQCNAADVFERFEPIMKPLGGRPHWGKCFTLTREEIRGMYPDSYDTFCKIRGALDPKGVFSNEFLERSFPPC